MARSQPRHRSGPKKGQFKRRGRSNPPARRRPASKSRYARPIKRAPVRRKRGSLSPAASRGAAASRRRRSRRNEPRYLNKAMFQIAGWAAGATLAQRYLTGAPFLAGMGAFGAFVPVIAVGGLGAWLARKVKSRPAGYALLGIAAGQLASVAINMWMPAAGGPQSSGAWLPRSAIVQRLPQRVRAPIQSPVNSIVVPA